MSAIPGSSSDLPPVNMSDHLSKPEFKAVWNNKTIKKLEKIANIHDRTALVEKIVKDITNQPDPYIKSTSLLNLNNNAALFTDREQQDKIISLFIHCFEPEHLSSSSDSIEEVKTFNPKDMQRLIFSYLNTLMSLKPGSILVRNESRNPRESTVSVIEIDKSKLLNRKVNDQMFDQGLMSLLNNLNNSIDFVVNHRDKFSSNDLEQIQDKLREVINNQENLKVALGYAFHPLVLVYLSKEKGESRFEHLTRTIDRVLNRIGNVRLESTRPHSSPGLAIEADNANTLKDHIYHLFSGEELAKELKANGLLLEYCTEERRNDDFFAILAIKQNPDAIHFIGDQLKANPIFMKFAEQIISEHNRQI